MGPTEAEREVQLVCRKYTMLAVASSSLRSEPAATTPMHTVCDALRLNAAVDATVDCSSALSTGCLCAWDGGGRTTFNLLL